MSNLDRFTELLGDGYPIELAVRLFRHWELLCKWNQKLNLTTIVSLEDAVRRHYVESLFLSSRLPPGPASLLDIGSGPGFPGVPIAASRPDIQVTLAESSQKKVVFLKEATRDLANVKVEASRAEQMQGGFDWVTLRAVRWEDSFARLGRRFALLVGEDDAPRITRRPDILWDAPLNLPGTLRGLLLLGEHVPRGT